MIEIDATLLRSPEDILKNLILRRDYVYVSSLLRSVFILMKLKFNSWKVAENVSIKVFYT